MAVEVYRAIRDDEPALWRERSDTEPEPPDELELRAPRGRDAHWSTDALVGVIEQALLRGAHLVRRGLFFRLLSGAALRFRSAPGRGEICCVALQDGRSEGFDVASYDRFVVLTKELRRLVADDRDVLVTLASGPSVDEDRLRSMLRWV